MKKQKNAYTWQFKARFRRNAFGWRSQPAVQRVKEAVSEIKKVARKDKVLAGEGAVLFLERVSPALAHVDSSSGAIGAAVNKAVDALVGIIAAAPVDKDTRQGWLIRLWEAYEEDDIPYIEILGDYWGRLCADKALASNWADELLPLCRMAWSPDPGLRGFYKGATNCLSALLAAERFDDILALLETGPSKMWAYRRYGVKALVAVGRRAEAIRYAEQEAGLNDNPVDIARACEEILLSSGMAEEAYRRYGLVANQAGTYLAWFRNLVRKYPKKETAEILRDLVAMTPGEEGKWFAAAKDAKLFNEAVGLANRSPCAPQTLIRAARDFAEKNPRFAVESGMAALRWLVEGYGYEVTANDVNEAYDYTMQAATNAGTESRTRKRISAVAAKTGAEASFVIRVLAQRLKSG
jgi:tetratricopeptide (TPR) repeat protein